MLELVTKDDARAQLRLDSSGGIGPDDAWLALAIPAVSSAIAGWLKDSWRLYEHELDSAGAVVLDSYGNPVPAEDSNGAPIVHPMVRLAVLVELDFQYRFRDGQGEHTATGDLYSGRHGYTLSRGATALLISMRKPTVS